MDCGRLASLRLIPMPPQSSKSTGRTSPTTGTSAPCPSSTLTCSPPACLASLSVAPGSNLARMMTVGSGLMLFACSVRASRLGRSLKTLLGLLLSGADWNSRRSFLLWRLRAIRSLPSIFQLAVLMPRIGGRGSGFWHTPTASEERAACYRLDTSFTHYVLGRQIHLSQQVRDRRLWPKPRANLTQLPLWLGTPCATERRRSGAWLRGNTPSPSEFIHTPDAHSWKGGPRKDHGYLRGRLNPEWIEWLMGFPAGWTGLGASAMRLCRKSPRKSSAA